MRIALLLLTIAASLAAQDPVRQGTQALREGRVSDAAQAFRQALDLDPRNRVALAALGYLAVQEERWEEASEWYNRVLDVDPANQEVHYDLGRIAWSQWAPVYAEARSHSGLRPGWTGMLPDASERTRLRGAWWDILEDGIWHLNRAVSLDPEYRDALVLLEQLVRQRAEIRATEAEYRQDVDLANNWSAKIRQLTTSRVIRDRLNRPIYSSRSVARFQFPDTCPAGSPRFTENKQLRDGNPDIVSGTGCVPETYPSGALAGRIQGTVRLEAAIGKDGKVQDLSVISGHPQLVAAAVDAVSRRVFQQMLVGGSPVVFTLPVEIEFVLPPR